MNYAHRKQIYREIESVRQSRVLAFITSDRKDMQTVIAQDCIHHFVDLLERIGPTERISLILHTDGGHTLAAWRLVNLMRMFCEELEVMIPLKALSAGTLISIGADRIVMTKQAALGPIDPSVNNPLNPQANIGGQSRPVPVSVENVRGFLGAAREELNIKEEESLASILLNLTNHVHPLVLGEIFRSQKQIRFLAEKLLPRQVTDDAKMKSIINFLCADSGSHDYTIDRREAVELGLKVEKPPDSLYKLLRAVHLSYTKELGMLEPFNPQSLLRNAEIEARVPYSITRGLVEGAAGGCYGFISEGVLQRVQFPTNAGVHDGVKDERIFESWRKLV